MTNTTEIDYEKYDINKAQAHVFELIRRIEKPDGKKLVELLLQYRYQWFSVFPIVLTPIVTSQQVAADKFFSDGISIYSDLEGAKVLVGLFKDNPIFEVTFVALSKQDKEDADNAVEVDTVVKMLEKAGTRHPHETMTFINVSWETPEQLIDDVQNSIT